MGSLRGGCAREVRPGNAAGPLAAAGLVLLAGSCLFSNGAWWFPGPSALAPVIGTAALISAGAMAPANRVTRFLGNRWLAYVGRVSYPWYLWHWPVLVIARSRRLYEPNLQIDLLAIAASFLLSVLTYELLEQPIQRRLARIRKPARVISLGVAGILVVGAVGASVGAWVRFGWWYSPEEARLDRARQDMPSLSCLLSEGQSLESLSKCIPGSSEKKVLLWGDSHANHWRPALEGATGGGRGLAVMTMRGCKPLPGPVGSSGCRAFNDHVRSRLATMKAEHRLAGVVLSARWPQGMGAAVPSVIEQASERAGVYFDERARTAEEAQRLFETDLREQLQAIDLAGLRTLVVLPSPVLRYSATHCLALRPAAECGVETRTLDRYVGGVVKIIEKVASEFDSVRVLDPMGFMCERGVCPIEVDGTLVYTDDDHVSRSFSERASRHFVEPVEWLLGDSAVAGEIR